MPRSSSVPVRMLQWYNAGVLQRLHYPTVCFLRELAYHLHLRAHTLASVPCTYALCRRKGRWQVWYDIWIASRSSLNWQDCGPAPMPCTCKLGTTTAALLLLYLVTSQPRLYSDAATAAFEVLFCPPATAAVARHTVYSVCRCSCSCLRVSRAHKTVLLICISSHGRTQGIGTL